jgi:hypothetical protein
MQLLQVYYFLILRKIFLLRGNLESGSASNGEANAHSVLGGLQLLESSDEPGRPASPCLKIGPKQVHGR